MSVHSCTHLWTERRAEDELIKSTCQNILLDQIDPFKLIVDLRDAVFTLVELA